MALWGQPVPWVIRPRRLDLFRNPDHAELTYMKKIRLRLIKLSVGLEPGDGNGLGIDRLLFFDGFCPLNAPARATRKFNEALHGGLHKEAYPLSDFNFFVQLENADILEQPGEVSPYSLFRNGNLNGGGSELHSGTISIDPDQSDSASKIRTFSGKRNDDRPVKFHLISEDFLARTDGGILLIGSAVTAD